MTFYKKSSFNFLLIEILISVVFIIHIININFINLSTSSSPTAYGLTNEDRYSSGYIHGCNDAKASNNGSKHPYLDSNGGLSAHTDTFMKGYNTGYRNCLTSSSPVALNAGDNNTLPNKDQLTSSSNTTSGHPLNTSTTFECPSISYDESIVAYLDTKNNDTVISSADAKGRLSKVTTINSIQPGSCPILSGNGREVSYEKPEKPGSYDIDLDVTDLSNVLFPSSTSNTSNLKNTTTSIDNEDSSSDDYGFGEYELSFDGKIIAYNWDSSAPDDGPATYTSISTKNNHGDFKKPINVLNTYILTDNVSNPHPSSASLSGDGKNIVFNNQTGKDRLEIYITKVANLNKTDQVTIKGINSDNSYNYFPAVSYDGKTIAYVANNGIYVAKLNEDKRWIISKVVANSTFNNIIDANNTSFSLSADGNKIAYAAFDGSFKQIFVKDISNIPVNNNDKEEKSTDRSTVGKTIQVTHNNFNNFEPVLSFDGSKVAFQSGNKVVVKNISWHS